MKKIFPVFLLLVIVLLLVSCGKKQETNIITKGQTTYEAGQSTDALLDYEYYLTSTTQHAEFECTCERPPESFRCGEMLNLKASAHCNGDTEFFTQVARYCLADEDTAPDSIQGSDYFRTDDNNIQIQVYAQENKKDDTATFSKEAPKGRTNGEKIAIFFVTDGCFTRWVYEWVE